MGRVIATTKKSYTMRMLGLIGVLSVLVGMLLVLPSWHTHASSLAAASNPGDWPTYMMDNARSNFNSTETIINRNTASKLKLHWAYHAGGAVVTQPMIVNGVIYWGAWDGYEYASDLNGKVLWRTYLGAVTEPCAPSNAGVTSTATIATVTINGQATQVVFVGGGKAQFYALNASNGHIIWNTTLGVSPSHMIWDAPAVYMGSVYIGVSSYGDCPLVQGQMIQLNATTGAIQHTFNVVANGCTGGGVWGSPAIDQATNMIYFTTGNMSSCKTSEKMAVALVELHTSDLSFVASWQVPASQQIGDGDFGTTPTFFQAMINGVVHQMVGVVNKSGYYYAFDRSNISAGPLWEKQLSTAPHNISPSAWDGTTLYEGSSMTTVHGQTCGGSIRALNPTNGGYLWEYCAPAKIFGALMVVPGLVVGGANRYLVVLDATSGQALFVYQDPTAGSSFWGAATVSNGVLYIGSTDGNLYAFGL